MTNEEAALILDPMTSRDALWKIDIFGVLLGAEAREEACNEACRVAARMLRSGGGVRHSYWIEDSDGMHCAECFARNKDRNATPFCPWCGARMDGAPK